MSDVYEKTGRDLEMFGGFLRCERCGRVQGLGDTVENVRTGWHSVSWAHDALVDAAADRGWRGPSGVCGWYPVKALSMADVLIGRITGAARTDGLIEVEVVERITREYLDGLMHLPKPPGALGFDRGRS